MSTNCVLKVVLEREVNNIWALPQRAYTWEDKACTHKATCMTYTHRHSYKMYDQYCGGSTSQPTISWDPFFQNCTLPTI